MFLHKDFMPYVVALYRQATEENKLKEIVQTITPISTILENNVELSFFLKIPFIPFEEKITVLNQLISKKVLPLWLSFLTLLGQNRKLSSLNIILTKFLEYADHKSGINHIKIVSAFSLDVSTKNALTAALEKQLGTPISLSITVDPTLIGGIVIHYYHHELDFSLKNAIFSLKSTLKELYS